MGGNFVSGSFASNVVSPIGVTSGIGSTLRWIVSCCSADFPLFVACFISFPLMIFLSCCHGQIFTASHVVSSDDSSCPLQFTLPALPRELFYVRQLPCFVKQCFFRAIEAEENFKLSLSASWHPVGFFACRRFGAEVDIYRTSRIFLQSLILRGPVG